MTGSDHIDVQKRLASRDNARVCPCLSQPLQKNIKSKLSRTAFFPQTSHLIADGSCQSWSAMAVTDSNSLMEGARRLKVQINGSHNKSKVPADRIETTLLAARSGTKITMIITLQQQLAAQVFFNIMNNMQ